MTGAADVSGSHGNGRLPFYCSGKAERMKVHVHCYAGHRGEEEPRSFDLGDRRIEVMEIIDRWLSPNHRYFKIRAYDGSVYILRHDEVAAEWEMSFFSRRPA